ncbi:hypothetical protein JCM3765_004115 [Sporobolomyces pararoseus]
MELLNESESRAFSSFLDSFGSTSSPPAPPGPPLFATSQYHPSTAQQYTQQDAYLLGGTGLAFRRPDQPGETARSELARGGADISQAGTGGAGSQTAWSQSITETLGPYQPHLQYLPSSFPNASSSSHFAPPPPAQHQPQRLSNSFHKALELEAAELAKQRKLQHAEELQKWMAQSQQSQPQPPTSRSSLDSPSPPKRTKSSENTNGGGGGGMGEQDAITAMLEAERKAGYAFGRTMNAAITRETSQSRERQRVFPPAPIQETRQHDREETFVEPLPPTSSRSTRRRPSSSATPQQDAISIPSLDAPMAAEQELPKPKTKRKAPSSSNTSSRSNSISSRQQIQPPPPSSSTSSTTAVDPESADASLFSISPTPFKTPQNIPPPLPLNDPSRPVRRPRKIRSSSSTIPAPTTSTSTSKSANAALLTNEQKKANHIASEQKRRAAIRQAYDGLCDVVPVLREAVQEFEERVKKLENENSGGRGKKRKGKGTDGKTGALMGGINVGGEKIDGRAGPKSEAVVLSKTVDHVRQLLANRAELLERLSKVHQEAQEKGIEVPPAVAHEWDEPYDGSSDEEDTPGGPVKAEEDDEMWEDE